MHHAGGTTTVTVNQEASGGIWVPLGIYDLDPAAGHKVALSDDANGSYVIADAVKFVRSTAPAYPVAGSTVTREFVYLDGRPVAILRRRQTKPPRQRRRPLRQP